MPNRIYPPSAYDDQLNLKLDIFTWSIIAFIMRPLVIFIASVTQKGDRFKILNTFYPDPLWALIGLVAALPTLCLLFAWWKRESGAGPRVRLMWHRGRVLIASSLVLNILFLAFPTWINHGHFPPLIATQIGLCCAALYYLFRSARVRDTFSDFPSSTVE